jgi:hypothetical protein
VLSPLQPGNDSTICRGGEPRGSSPIAFREAEFEDLHFPIGPQLDRQRFGTGISVGRARCSRMRRMTDASVDERDESQPPAARTGQPVESEGAPQQRRPPQTRSRRPGIGRGAD